MQLLNFFQSKFVFPFVFVFTVQTQIACAAQKPEILVTVDNLSVTANELEEALRSSPFYTQFNTMSREQQGSLRGNILKRLVTSKLLTLEAQSSQLANEASFQKEVAGFKKGLLYRYYMDSLRNKIKIPDDKLAEMKQAYKTNRNALSAAKASFITTQYAALYKLTIKNLRDKYHVVLHEKSVSVNATPETVFLEGDNGIKVTMQDVTDASDKHFIKTQDQLLERIYQYGELEVVSKAAAEAGIDVTDKINGYIKERLPALFLEKKQKQWTADETKLKAYFDAHPEMAIIPERWHLGMLVLKTREEANKALKRIRQGESLFKLAGEMSIDPYGRQHNGDMGWVREYSGNPVIENAIKNLENGKVSDVIETKKGYIIATILDRQPGGIRRFASMKDKVKQLLINEKMHDYLAELQSKHKIVWNLLKTKPEQNPKQKPGQKNTQSIKEAKIQ